MVYHLPDSLLGMVDMETRLKLESVADVRYSAPGTVAPWFFGAAEGSGDLTVVVF